MGKSRIPKTETDNALTYKTLKEAAKAAGLARQTFVRHLPEIPHRVAGRRVLITKAALQRWLEGHDMQDAA